MNPWRGGFPAPVASDDLDANTGFHARRWPFGAHYAPARDGLAKPLAAFRTAIFVWGDGLGPAALELAILGLLWALQR